MNCRKILLLGWLCLFFCLKTAFAVQTNSLYIIITDQNSAFVPSVVVRLKDEKELIKELKKSESESVFFSKLLPGKYVLEVEAKGFKPISREIEIKVGRNDITVKLEIVEIVENVEVDRDLQEKALDPREGVFSNFLTKDQLDALPEDPEELEKELKNQFGQDAVFQVDGFTGGKLPPKSQIASIRITRSSFDAEYHQLGATFIDIITKAGGSKWNGSVSFNFNDESFNARNPFAIARFPVQQRNFSAFFSGPIIKGKTSLFVSAFGNNSYRQENIIAALPSGNINDSVRSTTNFLYPSIKLSHNLSKTKTLNISYNGRISDSENLGVGEFNLPDRAFDSKILNHQFRASQSGYIGKRFLNEFRFQFTDETAKTTPTSDETAIIVLDAFNTGGAGNQSESRKQNLWFANNLLFGLGKIHAMKIGGLVEFERQSSESATNQNGTFTFSSLENFTLNRPSTFTQRLGLRKVNLSQTQIGAFVQDDIRLHKSFMLSVGLRYEWQNNFRDFNNFSPRVGFTWSPYRTGKTTFRGGAGIYYNWFETNSLAAILSQGITQPTETVIINPGFPNPFESGTSRILPQSYWQKADDLKNPYIFLASIGVQQQLNTRTSFSLLYKYQKGVHQLRSRDINAPFNFIRPNSEFGRVVQIESSGFFIQNSLNANFRGNLSKTINYSIDYTLSKNVNDNNGIFSLPSDNYNLRLDRAVSNLDQRHRLYASVFWRIRKNLNLSTSFIANSPLPYTITTGFDANGDTIFNDRPFNLERNSERGAWRKQIDTSLSWTIGLVKRKDGQTGAPGMIVISSAEAASGDIGIDTRYKYSLKLYSTAYNVFNFTNFTNFVGVQTSPFFRQPIAADSPRRIEFGLRLTF